MISIPDNELTNELYSILQELNGCHRNKEEVFESAIQDRLNNSLKAYMKSIEDSVVVLKKRTDSLDNLRRLSR